MCLLVGGILGPSHSAPAIDDACATRPDVLGISRIVEIDATEGPRFGSTHNHGTTFLEDGEVVLTFDDGPMRHYTQRVLKALDEHCTKATFFMVGRMAVADPEMVEEVARRGHTVGTHTWSHRNLTLTPANKATAEIELGLSAVAKALQAPPAPFFRTPYLRDNTLVRQYLASRHLASFGIDIESADFRTRNPAEVQRRVLSQLSAKRKGIILFHDIQPSTAGGLKGLLDELHKRGFKVVHVVPKGQAQTLANYDAIAEKELARKKAAAATSPLATRSAVWPVVPGGEAGAAQSGGIPWEDPGAAPATKPPARTKSKPAEQEPWQPRIFGY